MPGKENARCPPTSQSTASLSTSPPNPPPQCPQSIQPVTTQPHIPSLPADTKDHTEILHALLIALILIHKAQLLLHRTAHSPAHHDVLSKRPWTTAVSDISPVQSVRYVPVRTKHPPHPPSQICAFPQWFCRQLRRLSPTNSVRTPNRCRHRCCGLLLSMHLFARILSVKSQTSGC